MLAELDRKIAKINREVEGLIEKLTLDEKINLMCQYQDAVPRLGIEKYKHGTEAAHGMAWLGEATMFPQTIGLACSWDKELLNEIGEVIGTEARGFYSRDKEKNGLTLWAPTVDLNRDPRWGRSEESYGEDPLLAGRLAAEYVKGVQGDDPSYYRAGATLKHFYGNNNEKNRGFCSTDISEKIKREYYLRVFQIVMEEAAPLSMMTAYNEINGIPANVHPDLQNIVRNEWGWPGFVVSDAGDVLSLIKDHKYVETPEEALAETIKAGVDSITDDHEISKKAIGEAIAKQLLSENDLDEALKRCFRIRFLLGEMAENNPYDDIDESVIGREKHAETALDAARKCMVLLKNEDKILPLSSPLTSIALIGNMSNRIYRDWYSGEFISRSVPSECFSEFYTKLDCCDANDRVRICHKSTGLFLNDDGSFSEEGCVFELEDWGWNAHTLRSEASGKYLTCHDEGISCTADEVFGWFTKEVFYLDSRSSESTEIKSWNTAPLMVKDSRLQADDQSGPDGEIGISASTPESFVSIGAGDFCLEVVRDGFEEAMAAVEKCKIPLVMIGNHPLVNGKETVDRIDLVLPGRQYELARKVVEKNPKAVLCITSSYPYAIKELKKMYSTIIYTTHAGQASGEALRDIVSGKVNPSGRLPLSWYSDAKDLGDIMDYEIGKSRKTYLYHSGECDFPFGHGLSYSDFTYSDFKAEKNELSVGDEDLQFSVMVQNKSEIAGDEIVQLYVTFPESNKKRPLRQLMDFTKIKLAPGERGEAILNIRNSDLMVWNEENNQFVWETGTIRFFLGHSSREEICTEEVTLF